MNPSTSYVMNDLNAANANGIWNDVNAGSFNRLCETNNAKRCEIQCRSVRLIHGMSVCSNVQDDLRHESVIIMGSGVDRTSQRVPRSLF